jgi:hypothetical protein
MGDDLAAANVNRSYSLAAPSIAIFTFMLFFLYPRFENGAIRSSLGSRIDDAERALYSRRGDRFWLLGYTLLFLVPSLVLFSVGLLAVGSLWLALWAGVLTLCDPLLPQGPDSAEALVEPIPRMERSSGNQR